MPDEHRNPAAANANPATAADGVGAAGSVATGAASIDPAAAVLTDDTSAANPIAAAGNTATADTGSVDTSAANPAAAANTAAVDTSAANPVTHAGNTAAVDTSAANPITDAGNTAAADTSAANPITHAGNTAAAADTSAANPIAAAGNTDAGNTAAGNTDAADTGAANPITHAGNTAADAAGMIETRVRAALTRRHIAHWEWIAIDPQFGDTADFCREYGFDLPHCANTIIVASKRGPAAYCAGIVRGSDRLDVNRRVRALMGVSRASFASADETRRLTDMMIGGVTPLALPDDLPIYADRRLLAMDYIILGAGSRAAKLKLPPQELAKLPSLQFIDNLSIPAA